MLASAPVSGSSGGTLAPQKPNSYLVGKSPEVSHVCDALRPSVAAPGRPEVPPGDTGTRLPRFSQLEGEQARSTFHWDARGFPGRRRPPPMSPLEGLTHPARSAPPRAACPGPLTPATAEPRPQRTTPPEPRPSPRPAPTPAPPRVPQHRPPAHGPYCLTISHRPAPSSTAPGAGPPGSAPTSGGLHPGLPRPAPQCPRRLPPAASSRPGTPGPSSPRRSGSSGDGRRKPSGVDSKSGAQ